MVASFCQSLYNNNSYGSLRYNSFLLEYKFILLLFLNISLSFLLLALTNMSSS